MAARAEFRSAARPVLLAWALLAVAVVAGALASESRALGEIAVPEGFSLEIDSRGFTLPTSIAVVPNPGPGDDDPIYFVTELRGTIKVVTRDRSVRDFARVPTAGDQEDSLRGSSQHGLVGVCLAPEQGHVFVTFTDPDAEGVLRNRIMRFDAPAETYALRPDGEAVIGDALARFQASPSHQIGNCVVSDGEILVGIGDGGTASAAAQTSVLLGKIVCLAFDGGPCATPPVGTSGDEAYVWAYGFRNPFGVAVVDDSLYAIENGIAIDRFLRVHEGTDHRWRGTDQSFASFADVVFVPAIAPVQLAYVPAGASFMPPEWPAHFVTGAFGGAVVGTGIVMFAAPSAKSVPLTPTFVAEYRGTEGGQRFASVAVDEDGLLFAPMLALEDGEGVVLRLRFDPEASHDVHIAPSYTLARRSDMHAIERHGCTGCHSIDGVGGGIGPTLDKFAINWTLTDRLNSAAYEHQVAALDALDEEPFRSFATARRDVLAAEGSERTRVWLGYYLQEPRFDDPDARMPNLGLSAEEAAAVRKELLTVTRSTSGQARSLEERVRQYVAGNTRPLLLGSGLGGGFVGVLIVGAWLVARRRHPAVDGRRGRRS